MATTPYVRKSVRLDHPLAKLNGATKKYGWGMAYAHELAVWDEMGIEMIVAGSVIHHRDGETKNNEVANLIWFKSQSLHVQHHHKLKNGTSEEDALAALDPRDFRCFDEPLQRRIDELRFIEVGIEESTKGKTSERYKLYVDHHRKKGNKTVLSFDTWEKRRRAINEEMERYDA